MFIQRPRLHGSRRIGERFRIRLIPCKRGLRKMSFSNISNVTNVEPFLEICLVTYVMRSPSSFSTRSTIAACVVNVALAVAGTFLNSFVLFIFWKSAKLRSKLSYFTIMLLSVIDLGVVVVGHPLFVLTGINTILDTAKCLHQVLYTMAIYLFFGLSTWTLFIINIDRYFSIVHPISHRNYFTKRRFVITCIFFWFLAISHTVSRIYSTFLSTFLSAIVMCITIFTSLCTYVSIFFVARNKMLKLNKVSDNMHQEVSRNLVAFLRQLKMAKTCVLVVSLCFLCYLPISVVAGIQIIWQYSDKTPFSVVNASTWATTLATMNSTLNCLIFFWGNNELRKEGLKIIKKYFHG